MNLHRLKIPFNQHQPYVSCLFLGSAKFAQLWIIA